MPTHVYRCDTCDTDIERTISLKEKIPSVIPCLLGIHMALWVPQAVNFTVEGGTGAARGSAHR